MHTYIHTLKQVSSHLLGKNQIKFIAALKKLLLVSYPSCALFLLSYSID